MQREGRGEEPARARVRLLEVYDLRPGARGEVRRELEIDAERARRDDEPDEPIDQAQADGARALEDARSWR